MVERFFLSLKFFTLLIYIILRVVRTYNTLKLNITLQHQFFKTASFFYQLFWDNVQSYRSTYKQIIVLNLNNIDGAIFEKTKQHS